jgi:FHA domain
VGAGPLIFLCLEDRYPLLTLTSLNGQDKGRVFQLTGEQPELLGRQASTFKLTDAQTSRKHAEILLENNTWLIRDLDSTNGTWVNGQKISQITELEVGDRIVIGRHQFRVSQITDLPAPSPKPLPTPPEPIIGQEDLATMGADLADSLSADILDNDDLDLPNTSEPPLDDELAQTLNTTDPSHSETQTQTPDSTDSQDGVIDLDALLGGTSSDDNQPPAPSVPQEQDNEYDETKSPASPSEQGVIDLDALLADEIVSPPSPPDTPHQAPSTPEISSTQDDSTHDVDSPQQHMDLDPGAILSDADTQPPSSPTAETSSDEPIAETDLTVEPPTDEPPVDTPPAEVLQDASEPDLIDDIDALLDDLVDSNQDSSVAPDFIAEAPPTPDREPDSDPPSDQAMIDSPDDDPDNLIDIDILASATPSNTWPQAPPSGLDTTPSTPDELHAQPIETDTDSVADTEPQVSTDDTGQAPDDSDILDSTDSQLHSGQDHDEGLNVNIDTTPGTTPDSTPGITPDSTHDDQPDTTADDSATGSTTDEPPQPLEDEAQAQVEQETVEEAVDPVAPDPVEEPQLEDSERLLLLSPDEQTQAVAGYKRSKLKTLATLILVFAAVAASVFIAINLFSPNDDANASQIKQDPAQPDATEVSNTTTPPTHTPQQDPTPADPITPDAPPQITPNADTSRLTPAPTASPIKNITPATPEPEPQQNPQTLTPYTPAPPAQAPTNNALIADPFADVTTTVFDTHPAPPPAQGDSSHGPAPGSVPAVSPAPVSITQTPADQTDKTPPTEQDSPIGLLPATTNPRPTIDAPSHTPHPDTSPDSPTHPDQSHLDLLAGAVDAQHQPGTQVTEQAAFAGARRIVYVVDASGSLVDRFPRVLAELNLAISNLQEDQAFTAIFFGADGVTEVPPVGLKWANRQTKRSTRDWIDPDNGNLTAWGRGDLLQALQLATDYGADEIIILSDNLIGRHPSQEKIDTLLDDIAKLTTDKVQQIHVIQFFTRDPKLVLKTIAERFNGTYHRIPTVTESSAEHPSEYPLGIP